MVERGCLLQSIIFGIDSLSFQGISWNMQMKLHIHRKKSRKNTISTLSSICQHHVLPKRKDESTPGGPKPVVVETLWISIEDFCFDTWIWMVMMTMMTMVVVMIMMWWWWRWWYWWCWWWRGGRWWQWRGFILIEDFDLGRWIWGGRGAWRHHLVGNRGCCPSRSEAHYSLWSASWHSDDYSFFVGRRFRIMEFKESKWLSYYFPQVFLNKLFWGGGF